jgi:RNA polymerase sigma factor (sigma-70 family)
MGVAHINRSHVIPPISETAPDRHILDRVLNAAGLDAAAEIFTRVAQIICGNGLLGSEDVVVVTSAEVEQEFARFVEEVEPRLLRALVGAYGPEVGREATRDALSYAWERWDQVSTLDNPVGYLYRVGQSRSRSYRRRRAWFPEIPEKELPAIDPRLSSAFRQLSQRQRAAVVLLFVEELSEREAADALGVSRATVRKHADRGLTKLRTALGVSDVE